MNTPAHILIGAAAFGRGKGLPVFWAAALGAMLPDLSLYVLAGTSLFILGISPAIVFGELYFSPLWQTIFAIDNSFFVWGALLGLSVWRKSAWATALCAAALLHVALDFPLHHDDGRAHFWPFSGWVFESPLSYWDTDHGASWIGPLEALLATLAAFAIWKARLGLVASIFCAVLLALELWVVFNWLFLFTDS